MPEQDQEKYLTETCTKQIAKRGLRKLLTEIASVKFLLLCYVCVGVPMKWIGDTLGLSTALVIIGMREVPIEAIIGKLTGGEK